MAQLLSPIPGAKAIAPPSVTVMGTAKPMEPQAMHTEQAAALASEISALHQVSALHSTVAQGSMVVTGDSASLASHNAVPDQLQHQAHLARKVPLRKRQSAFPTKGQVAPGRKECAGAHVHYVNCGCHCPAAGIACVQR